MFLTRNTTAILIDKCDECGDDTTCQMVKDDTGRLPVCKACKDKYFPTTAHLGLGARLATRKPAVSMA